MTDRYAVIGNPVAHSKSPGIHAEFARQCGHDLEYGRIEAPLDGFAAAVTAFFAAGGKGLNVTLPFKEQAFALCRRTSQRARAAQAVNTLVFEDDVYGDTTDGAGLVADLSRNLGVHLAGRRVLLMGAGGAARGVVASLLDSGVSTLVIANRTVDKARALAARFPPAQAAAYGDLQGDFDLVVNATSAGLQLEEIVLPHGVLNKRVLAYDMVYGRRTPFLAQARQCGARTADGLGMLVEQAAESFEIWRGVRPATRPVLERLRAG
ncbi:MAG TPA: shikimate dehydrogenase [Burkholderiales bacterium]|nr:shikimate dehydrogenase [Burkholderiales bacterium]